MKFFNKKLLNSITIIIPNAVLKLTIFPGVLRWLMS